MLEPAVEFQGTQVAIVRGQTVGREGRTGVSFQAGHPDSLAAVCVELCKNPGRRRELGANAARWVRLNRSWTAVAAGYLDAYDFAFQAYERRHAIGVETKHPFTDDQARRSAR